MTKIITKTALRSPSELLADTAATKKAAARFEAICGGAVRAYIAGEKAIATAHGAQLSAFVAAWEGVAPISNDDWKENYAAPMLSHLIAANVPEASAKVKATHLKMCALFVTNKLAMPEGVQSLRALYDAAPTLLRAAGIIDARRGSKGPDDARANGEGSKAAAADVEAVEDWFDDDAEGKAQARGVIERFAGDAYRAAAFLTVAEGSVSLAAILSNVLPKYEDEFRQFAASLMPEGNARKGKARA